MKKIFYSLLLFASATLFAQKNPTTRFAVANDVVGTVDMFNAKKNIIQSMKVYKASSNLPQSLKKYSDIAEKGLSEFKIKPEFDNLDTITLAQLNEQNELPKDNTVFIDGYEFPNTETKVFGDILAKTEVKDANGKKSLFISTLR